MCFSQYEDIPNMEFQPDLGELLRQLPYPKSHLRNLMLGQQAGMVGLLGLR